MNVACYCAVCIYDVINLYRYNVIIFNVQTFTTLKQIM